MAERVEVSVDVIRWALARSGRSEAALIDKVPRLAQMKGADSLSLSFGDVEHLASTTRTPLGFFFLKEPPAETLPLPDFRTVKDQSVGGMSPELIETVLLMHSRQQWFKEYAHGEGYQNVDFVGSAEVTESPQDLAERIRDELKLGYGWASSLRSFEEAVSFVRDLFQAHGVLVVINGIVGNNTGRRLNADEFRGFVLVDEIAPLLFVNGTDTKSAQMFTFFHELAHLWLGRSGIVDLDAAANSNGALEMFCNRVAAEVLVPESELREVWAAAPTLNDFLSRPSKKFKVSPIVIARRLRDTQLISQPVFFDFYNAYVSRGFPEPASLGEPGGNFYNKQNNRIGKRFMRAVARATAEGKLSFTHAFRLTGLTSATFDKYVQAIGGL